MTIKNRWSQFCGFDLWIEDTADRMKNTLWNPVYGEQWVSKACNCEKIMKNEIKSCCKMWNSAKVENNKMNRQRKCYLLWWEKHERHNPCC